MPTLILTPRFTADAQALWRAARTLGWGVERLGSWRVPDELLSAEEPVLYVEALFSATIAERFGMELPEPPEDWMVRLPEEYRNRRVELTTLREARGRTVRAFMKPPNDKSFEARVCTGAELPAEFAPEMAVLVSEVVEWEGEFRCFVLDRQVRTVSVYSRRGVAQREHDFAATPDELDAATAFATAVVRDLRVDLPRACVVDVGVIVGRGWGVIEQNAAWGAGIYGCDPVRVLEVLRHAGVRNGG